MNLFTKLCIVLLGCLASFASAQFYANTPVLQLSARNFNELVLDTNHLTVVEFYAPWCGYCKQLTPEYIRAAKKLAGIVKVAAINCDEEMNKPVCGKYQVEGFPTLKVFGPRNRKQGKTGSKGVSEVIENYSGPRTAKAIVDTMLYKFHGGKFYTGKLKTVAKEADVESLLKGTDQTRVVLLSKPKPDANAAASASMPALFRSLSLDFKSPDVTFAFVKQPKLIAKLASELDLPESSSSTLVVLPAGEASPVVYDGTALKREGIVPFLEQHIKRTDAIDRKPSSKSKSKSKKGPAFKKRKQQRNDEL